MECFFFQPFESLEAFKKKANLFKFDKIDDDDDDSNNNNFHLMINVDKFKFHNMIKN